MRWKALQISIRFLLCNIICCKYSFGVVKKTCLENVGKTSKIKTFWSKQGQFRCDNLSLLVRVTTITGEE